MQICKLLIASNYYFRKHLLKLLLGHVIIWSRKHQHMGPFLGGCVQLVNVRLQAETLLGRKHLYWLYFFDFLGQYVIMSKGNKICFNNCWPTFKLSRWGSVPIEIPCQEEKEANSSWFLPQYHNPPLTSINHRKRIFSLQNPPRHGVITCLPKSQIRAMLIEADSG